MLCSAFVFWETVLLRRISEFVVKIALPVAYWLSAFPGTMVLSTIAVPVLKIFAPVQVGYIAGNGDVLHRQRSGTIDAAAFVKNSVASNNAALYEQRAKVVDATAGMCDVPPRHRGVV